VAFHPDVERFLSESRRLSEAIGAIQSAAFDDLRVRRASPDEPDVMPEIDGWGALTGLYLGEGIVNRYRPAQIEELFMSALRECYAVLGDRRSQAAQAAAPDLDPELWFGTPAEPVSGSEVADNHEGSRQ
jgi:hypothetical protein